jgi:NAD(P)-dependent dehydrogenase (short-subunit alcohol dehydrogenase family)
MFNLSGKKALVTGGSRGIGRGIVLALAQQGADVAINYNASADKAEAVAEEVRKLGRQAIVIQADVSQSTQVKQMFSQLESEWGRLDILVNNAGVLDYSPFTDISEEAWDRVIDTNLKGQFLCAQQAAKMMIKNNWGRIINIASISSGGVGIGFPHLSHYTASKGGVTAITENLALELGPEGINVNAIAPGAIETDMSKGMDEEQKKGLIARLPKRRMGQPEDIGAAAAFLASDEAGYVTGIVMYVDGGWLTS